MVRQDLKRLESLMLNSFDHNKSTNSVGSDTAAPLLLEEGRRSLTELPSLRQSLDSAQGRPSAM